MVTHDLRLVDYCDKVYLMEDGRLSERKLTKFEVFVFRIWRLFSLFYNMFAIIDSNKKLFLINGRILILE